MTNAKSRLPEMLAGSLHVFVAYDWGEEVDLARADTIIPSESQILPRRRRTPSSIAYRPRPSRFALNPVLVELPILGKRDAAAEATVFDFAAASIALHIPFKLSPDKLSHLAAALAQSELLQQAATAALRPGIDALVRMARWISAVGSGTIVCG